jgi:hypothetical protein
VFGMWAMTGWDRGRGFGLKSQEGQHIICNGQQRRA